MEFIHPAVHLASVFHSTISLTPPQHTVDRAIMISPNVDTKPFSLADGSQDDSKPNIDSVSAAMSEIPPAVKTVATKDNMTMVHFFKKLMSISSKISFFSLLTYYT